MALRAEMALAGGSAKGAAVMPGSDVGFDGSNPAAFGATWAPLMGWEGFFGLRAD